MTIKTSGNQTPPHAHPTNYEKTMTWHFQPEYDSLSDTQTWHELILSPLASVAASNGWDEEEEHVVLNVAISKGLLPPTSESASCPEAIRALAKLKSSTTLCHRAERSLAEVISAIKPERGSILADRIYEAMLDVAQASAPPRRNFSIDARESAELRRLFHVFREAKDSGKRIAVSVSPAASPDGAPIVSDPSMPLITRTPWQWAAEWNENLSNRTFEVLAAMHGEHEAERKRGAGRLEGMKTLSEALTAADQYPWCDSGVAVPPSDWTDARVWIVGDLHGDSETLNRALSFMGVITDDSGVDTIPSGNAIVFLGDLGDRGAGTLAVWLRVAALKARHPDRVQILRGNHEEVQEVRLTRPDGSLMKSTWSIPTTTDMEAYLTLAFALRGSLENLLSVFDFLPDVLVLPGGWLALHGALPPRWKDNDGWSPTLDPSEKSALSIEGVSDLRKPQVRSAIRWTDAQDRPDVDFGWSGHARGSRLFAAAADHRHWCSILGEFRMIHGHTHPEEGARLEWNGNCIALNTSRHTSPRQAIACLRNGEITTHNITPTV